MIIKHKCPTCGKPAELSSEMKLGSLSIRTYKCGHSETLMGVQASSTFELIESIDHKKLFKYQVDTCEFLDGNDGRALIAHEMGVGKTPISLAWLHDHPEARPFVGVVKSGLRFQWLKESIRWCDFNCQLIETKKDYLLPGMDGYFVSLDSLRLFYKSKDDDESRLKQFMNKIGVKTVIIDECQLIKNQTSQRTTELKKLCQGVDHVIALSGTPIKNNAAEYFPILNILRPDKFPSHKTFVYGWCDSYWNGYGTKTGGLKDPKAFHEFTKDFIIRYERKDVLPDLPAIFRQFQFCDLGKEVEAAYQNEVREFQDYYSHSGESGIQRQANILAYLSRMRHLTGIAKVEPVVEYIEDFITTTDRKIVIFLHHKDVAWMLKTKLEKIREQWPAEWGKEILEIASEMDAFQRDGALQKFWQSDYRIMIASTLASGEGLNMQCCSDCIMMERQWNPANEEQAEARFPRPGQLADKINAMYFISIGTVDEFFSELVEQKREIVSKTMSGEAVKWDETSLMRDLAMTLAEKGGRKWGW